MSETLEMDQLQKLINNNESEKALIIALIGWGLTPIELATVEVQHVMNQKGEFLENWIISKDFAHNGVQRAVTTTNAFLPVLTVQVENLQENKLTKGLTPAFANLRPDAKFFRNKRGGEYELTTRRSGKIEARGVTEKVKKMIKRAGLDRDGITPKGLRISAACFYYSAGMSLIDIKMYFGAKQLQTVSSWIKPEKADVEAAQKAVFARVNWKKG